jgi:hypothetical protein
VANPGSALGETIGALLEGEIHRILKPLAENSGCIYIATGPPSPTTGKPTKLILRDEDDNEYNVDSVIINNRFQPLVIIESKYIRYKKTQPRQGKLDLHGAHQTAPTLQHCPQVHCGAHGELEQAFQTAATQF